LAAQQKKAGDNSRLFGANGDSGRTAGNQAPAPARAQAAYRLTSLRGEAAFRRVRRGRSASGHYLSVRWLPLNQDEVRVGLVASRKVGKAVIRNRVRRRLKSALHEVFLPPMELMVIARPEAAGANYQQLATDLYRTLERAGVYRNNPAGSAGNREGEAPP
jgi:ribonuclease P protein component